MTELISNTAAPMPLLHGTLDVTIFEAKFHKPKFIVGLLGLVPKVEGLPTVLPQLYATVDLYNARVGRTRIDDRNSDNPQWHERFKIYCAHYSTDVVFSIKEWRPVNPPLIGRAYLPVQDLLSKGKEAGIDRWLPILDEDRKPLANGPLIHVKVIFTPVADEPNWGRGIIGQGQAQQQQYMGVPRTFFKQRPGCRLTLYQDAHVLDTYQPNIQLAGGRKYEPRRCWEDIYDAIAGARHLVYITGWAFNPDVTLVRDDGSREHDGRGISIGELLKRKASVDGVRVLMLVWDDPSSVLNTGVIAHGLARTKDYEAFNYFRGSGVHCIPCPRKIDASETLIDYRKTGSYSHHQKSIIVDVKGDGGDDDRRRIVSFVGGLDIADGRYDTQDHSLFKTLKTPQHSNDFHQGNIPGACYAKGGPREPWHDIHCKVEGPAAWDVLHNFEHRWSKQGGRDDLLIHNQFLLPTMPEQGDLLVDLTGLEDKVAPMSTPAVPADDREAWNVQVFRSIDGSSCVGFPKTPAEAEASGLISGKDQVIDRSIQDAYIHAIRRAKSFIYIENQYFMGSSYAWKPDGIKPDDIRAVQTIPREISLKIVSKIKAGEDFAVYVVLPMWPEGTPSGLWGMQVQTMLSWQARTMEMMYTDIAKALKDTNSTRKPRDYLSFFCLGNREKKVPGEYEPTDRPEHGSDYEKAQKARRTMIYIHSKLMIVDDEYLIIGSANINQRSMDGARDSEIAIGAYQPSHINNTGNGQVARGQVHGFRKSLWYEHLGGGLETPELQDPGSQACMRAVKDKAEGFWSQYVSEKLDDDLHGHLLSYPIQVTDDGRVVTRPGWDCFPDTDAPILGSIGAVVAIGGLFTSFAATT